MKTIRVQFGWISRTALSLGLGAVGAMAQDPAKVTPAASKVRLENDRVRVMEVEMAPGEKIASHSHPDHVVYLLTDAKMKETFADGKGGEKGGKKGEALWYAAVTHAVENVGQSALRGIVVELKESASTPSAATPPDKDPVKLIPDQTKVLFENDRMRVLEARTKAGGKAAMHGHPAMVTYALTDVKVKFADGAGTVSEKQWNAGDVAWHEPFSHGVENVGPNELVVVHFELKEPAKKTGK